MVRRVLATVFLLLGAVFASAGLFGPGTVVRIPFGLLFLVAAALVWRNWEIIAGGFSPPLFDGMTAYGDDHYRAVDDHYRRDGQSNYSEPC